MEYEEDIIEEEEHVKRKWPVILMAVFLILLMISLTFASGNIREIIVSLAESSLIEDGLVEQDVTVQFENDTYEEILELYNADLATEFKVCLMGYFDGKYYVTSLYFPEMYSQSYNQVVSEVCPEDTLISLHSHPYRHCTASDQDLDNLDKAKEESEFALIGIMCEEERFHFYG